MGKTVAVNEIAVVEQVRGDKPCTGHAAAECMYGPEMWCCDFEVTKCLCDGWDDAQLKELCDQYVPVNPKSCNEKLGFLPEVHVDNMKTVAVNEIAVVEQVRGDKPCTGHA